MKLRRRERKLHRKFHEQLDLLCKLKTRNETSDRWQNRCDAILLSSSFFFFLRERSDLLIDATSSTEAKQIARPRIVFPNVRRDFPSLSRIRFGRKSWAATSHRVSFYINCKLYRTKLVSNITFQVQADWQAEMEECQAPTRGSVSRTCSLEFSAKIRRSTTRCPWQFPSLRKHFDDRPFYDRPCRLEIFNPSAR